MVDSNLNSGGNMPNPEWTTEVGAPTIWAVDLSSVNLSDMVNNEVTSNYVWPQLDDLSQQSLDEDKLSSLVGNLDLWSSQKQDLRENQSMFTDTWNAPKKQIDQDENFWSYLRVFFIWSVVMLLGVVLLAVTFSFNKYLKAASQNVVPASDVEFVNKYKTTFKKVKWRFWKDNIDNYSRPNADSDSFQNDVNRIINATDIDYIDKKDLLSSSVASFVHTAENRANEVETLRQEIARQGFLPEEVKLILSDNQAIETIQRSMNALEVIKFSTAAKVFSYMSTTLSNIAEMVKMSGVNGSVVGDFLTRITSRWEKDINAYVNMCYLNPFEYDSDCDVIWDLDLYYKSILKDESININLLKNVMNWMNQLLENEDSATFSITFNGFNARDKDITFDIEVFTSQTDERALMAQWKRNPNIFILTSIVNLLKQSTFIIGAKVDMNSVDVEERTLSRGGFTTNVNYSNQSFTVPIQKNTEREIFDYIDVNKVLEIIDKLKLKDEEIQESEDLQEIEDLQKTEDETYVDDWEESEYYDETNKSDWYLEETSSLDVDGTIDASENLESNQSEIWNTIENEIPVSEDENL